MKISASAPPALVGALALLGVFALPGSAQATLHGFCAGTGQCIDNGTNSPTSSNPPASFGFTTSPGPTSGDLLIDILTPDNQTAGPSFSLTGTSSATATLFSTTPWTSGALDAYLGSRQARTTRSAPTFPPLRPSIPAPLASLSIGPTSALLRFRARATQHEPPRKHRFGGPPSRFLHCRLL
jgi:hypothetical protein